MEVIEIKIAEDDTDFEAAKTLFSEYAASLPFDLNFQGFQKELSEIDRQYQQPEGALLLCRLADGTPAGCAGIRKLDEHIAELKRLYVKPEFRDLKIGKQLLTKALVTARELEYHSIRLDSVPGQEKAQSLYMQLGFYVIEPYRYNPMPGTVYLEKILS